MHQDPDLFWQCTPRETHAIAESFLGWQDVEQRRHGQVAAAAWNAAPGRTARDWRKWQDYCPPFSKRNEKRGLSKEELVRQAQQQRNQVYGGRF